MSFSLSERPHWGAYSAPQTPYLVSRGRLCGRRGMERRKGLREGKREREGNGKGGERGKLKGIAPLLLGDRRIKYWTIFTFLHRNLSSKFCNKVIIKYPTAPEKCCCSTVCNINFRISQDSVVKRSNVDRVCAHFSSRLRLQPVSC